MLWANEQLVVSLPRVSIEQSGGPSGAARSAGQLLHTRPKWRASRLLGWRKTKSNRGDKAQWLMPPQVNTVRRKTSEFTGPRNSARGPRIVTKWPEHLCRRMQRNVSDRELCRRSQLVAAGSALAASSAHLRLPPPLPIGFPGHANSSALKLEAGVACVCLRMVTHISIYCSPLGDLVCGRPILAPAAKSPAGLADPASELDGPINFPLLHASARDNKFQSKLPGPKGCRRGGDLFVSRREQQISSNQAAGATDADAGRNIVLSNAPL